MRSIVAGVAPIALILSMYSPSAVCATPPSNLSELAQTLSEMSDACSKLAQDAHTSFSVATYKASLDSQLAQTKAEDDVTLYGMAHGHRETSQYMLDRMRENTQNDAANSKQISDKLSSDKQEVQSCVKDAEQRGKDLYATFKSKHKRSAKDAEPLVTAWYTNLDEIEVDHPNGGSTTEAAWKTAKTRAELSAI